MPALGFGVLLRVGTTMIEAVLARGLVLARGFVVLSSSLASARSRSLFRSISILLVVCQVSRRVVVFVVIARSVETSPSSSAVVGLIRQVGTDSLHDLKVPRIRRLLELAVQTRIRTVETRKLAQPNTKSTRNLVVELLQTSEPLIGRFVFHLEGTEHATNRIEIVLFLKLLSKEAVDIQQSSVRVDSPGTVLRKLALRHASKATHQGRLDLGVFVLREVVLDVRNKLEVEGVKALPLLRLVVALALPRILQGGRDLHRQMVPRFVILRGDGRIVAERLLLTRRDEFPGEP
ncbi:hypothetical protein BZA70DRAFT_277209 [Myxozyma melibiosi]|uniref:Secreted protein n=1 Tax=Myxozyma melibiosi TaxID=54550 RepID=A0ABR1F7N7_9ASCO